MPAVQALAPQTLPVIAASAFRARALLLGGRLDLRALTGDDILGRMPTAMRVAPGGIAVLFRYGVAVLFDVAPEAEHALRVRLAPHLEHRYEAPEAEEIEVRVDPSRTEGLQEGIVFLQSAALPRLQLIAEVLSRSVLLGHYEGRIAADFDRIEPMAAELERSGRIGGRTRHYLQRIGRLLLIEQRMVVRAEVLDKPELLWDHPELERLFSLLEAEFELRERYEGLDRKLELIGRTVRTLVDLLNARHGLRVEWYIVVLIVFEILLTLYQMWKP
jgi:uncharacterized Rmd1/YagE family protein